MSLLDKLPRPNLRLAFAALVAIGILHICVTLAAPSLSTTSAFQRLRPLLPANTMRVLPPLGPEMQPLPFMTPDVRYAMCRVDTSGGPVSVNVVLADRGWTMGLYSAEGENLYAATGQLGRVTEIALQLIRSDERFAGLTPEARGLAVQGPLTVAVREGVLVVRAPDQGIAYSVRTENELSRTTCEAAAAEEG